jgi:hypothetical protein
MWVLFFSSYIYKYFKIFVQHRETWHLSEQFVFFSLTIAAITISFASMWLQCESTCQIEYFKGSDQPVS